MATSIHKSQKEYGVQSTFASITGSRGIIQQSIEYKGIRQRCGEAFSSSNKMSRDIFWTHVHSFSSIFTEVIFPVPGNLE